MSAIPVQVGTNARTSFETLDSANGIRVAPASSPTVLSVHVDGVINSTLTSAATITQLQNATPANITGYYELVVPTTSLGLNSDMYVTIQATISGFTATKVFKFVIVANDNAVPVIR